MIIGLQCNIQLSVVAPSAHLWMARISIVTLHCFSLQDPGAFFFFFLPPFVARESRRWERKRGVRNNTSKEERKGKKKNLDLVLGLLDGTHWPAADCWHVGTWDEVTLSLSTSVQGMCRLAFSQATRGGHRHQEKGCLLEGWKRKRSILCTAPRQGKPSKASSMTSPPSLESRTIEVTRGVTNR